MGWLRRPLVWVLVATLVVLGALRARGRLAPAWALDRRARLGLGARVAGPLREDLRGEKVVIAAGRYRFLVRLPERGAGAALRPGMAVRLIGVLRIGRAPRNPGDFDEAAFLADRGLSGVFEVESLELEDAPVPRRWLPSAAAEGARRSLQARLRAALSPDEARVLEGLMLGYKGALPRELNRAFQDAGIMHLIVPSGAKVAAVLGLSALLCGLLSLSMAPRMLVCGLVGGFYVLMVGAEPPYLRAYLTALAYFGARLAGREADAPQALVLSALAVVALDPRAPFSAGFQMTYAAMAGLVVALPRLARLGRVKALLLITILVQVMLWPVFANTFGRGSLIAPLANLLCVPLASVLMAGGLGLWLFPGLAALVAPLVRWFIALCRLLAAPAWASVALAPMSSARVAAYYAVAFAALIPGSRKLRVALACAGLALWTGARGLERARAPLLRVVYLRQPRGRVAALASFSGAPPWLVGSAPAALVERALRAEGESAIARVVRARDFRACAGAVCCRFDPPRVERGGTEFDILAPRLRASAVEVTTDGSHIELRELPRQADQFGRLVL